MILSSIIIPTFNQNAFYLKAALQSAAFQTIPCELVVVDDGSTPPQEVVVEKVLAGYSEKHGVPAKYVYQDNKGVAGALNRGLEEAEGEYIQWLPSDDLFFYGKTEAQVSTMKRFNEKVSYCSYQEGVPITVNTWSAAQYPTQEKLFNELRKHCFINAATVVWHRSVFEEVGTFSDSMVHAQDYEFLLRCAEKYNFYAYNTPLVRRRVHDGQMLRTLTDPEEAEKKKRDMEYIADRYNAEGEVWLPTE